MTKQFDYDGAVESHYAEVEKIQKRHIAEREDLSNEAYYGALNILNVSDVRYSFYIPSMFWEGSQSQAEAIYYLICKAKHGDSEADRILREAVSEYVDEVS